MQFLKVITDIFDWLQSTGILAALATLILVVIKQVQPYLKTHIKNKQLGQITDFAMTTVTKFATLEGLSKADRKKAADKDVSDFADEFRSSWVTPEIIDSIVESAYQQFKKLGYDNHKPKTTDEPADDSAKVQESPATPAAPNVQVTTPKPELEAEPVSGAPQNQEKPVVNSGSDSNA